jgi:hypothetical protein
MVQLLKVVGEINRALAADELDDMISERSIVARAQAALDFVDIMDDSPDCYDEQGEVTGNLGVDKLAAVSAIRRFWSDGEIS